MLSQVKHGSFWCGIRWCLEILRSTARGPGRDAWSVGSTPWISVSGTSQDVACGRPLHANWNDQLLTRLTCKSACEETPIFLPWRELFLSLTVYLLICLSCCLTLFRCRCSSLLVSLSVSGVLVMSLCLSISLSIFVQLYIFVHIQVHQFIRAHVPVFTCSFRGMKVGK